MSPPRISTTLALGGACAASAWSPALTAIGPVRRRLAPRLSGISPDQHIALTFDDGPDPASTPAFLDLLAEHDRRATFFVLGSQAADQPELVRRMVDEGHEVAVHGWAHRCTASSAPTQLVRDLRVASQVIEDITGIRSCWYRPPYGVITTETLIACRTNGLTPVLWSAWGREWEGSSTPERIVRSIKRTLRPGGTVLLHDTDLHAPHGNWRRTHEATARLLHGSLANASVGPLREHWVGRSEPRRDHRSQGPAALRAAPPMR